MKELDEYQSRSLLRFTTAGSVDDGKSTLIGRLLHDTKNIFDDVYKDLKSKQSNKDEFDLSLITDGLRAEREQKITIDVAYRYFSTPNRKFILADSPGHEQYTRNMATGASTAHAAIILIDAKNGITPQTKRHTFISSLLGVRHFLVAINKMDLVDYDSKVFGKIRRDFKKFASKLDIPDLHFIPVSALMGDNVVTPSENTKWYRGETIIGHLENLYIDSDENLVDFRMPVQMVIRPDQDFRGIAGQVASGVVRLGSEVVALPSDKKAKVTGIQGPQGPQEQAFVGQSVVLELDTEIDISRGDMIANPKNQPNKLSQFEMMCVWMSSTPMSADKTYYIKHSTNMTRGVVSQLDYKVDVNSLSRVKSDTLQLNEIGRMRCETFSDIYFDSYRKNRATGRLILIDPDTNETVGAGMIIDRIPFSQMAPRITGEEAKQSIKSVKLLSRPKVIWLEGLSGAGKSAIGDELKTIFDANKILCTRLDGDKLRDKLCKDLGFSQEDRTENLRRAAHVAKELQNSGVTVIASFITPLNAQRKMIREIIGEDFCEVFVSTPLADCEKRDPKGLYQRARNKEIKGMTGIDSPFEEPTSAQLTIQTANSTVVQSANQVLEALLAQDNQFLEVKKN